MDSQALFVLLGASYFVVPFLLSLVLRRGHRSIAAFGLLPIGVEWALAYHDNQVDNGGDWNPGLELAAVTGLGALFNAVVWLLGVLAGVGVRRLIDRIRAGAQHAGAERVRTRGTG